MMGLGKAKLCTKFEVASLTHCRNIGEPKILQSADQGHAHFFGWNFMTGLGKPQLQAKFDVASFSRYRNIKGEPENLGNSPSRGPSLPYL